MPFRRGVLLLAIVAALALPGVAPAAVHTPVPVPPGTPFHPAPLHTNDACSLGITGTASSTTDLFLPDDVYYVLLKPATCGACSLTAISQVHIQMNFEEPCMMPIRIGLVQATNSFCPQPDLGHILFPLTDASVLATDTGIGDYVIAAPADWKIHGNAFLVVDFADTCAGVTVQPQLANLAGCTHCSAYEFSDGFQDVCTATGTGPLISADVVECILTGALPASWGRLKMHYR